MCYRVMKHEIIFQKFANFIQENYTFEVDYAIWGLVSDDTHIWVSKLGHHWFK